ncbi:MAG: hypothetical protein WC467_03780 [Patescibacteria group bacterium]
MEKKIRPASIFIALSFLAIGGTALFMGIKIIIPHWPTIVQASSSAAIYTAIISVAACCGTFYALGKDFKFLSVKVGKKIILSSIVIFTINTFALFNKFGLLNLWLIILGGLFLLSLLYLTYRYLENDKDSNLPMVLAIFLLIGFMYYLDAIIFSWNQPYLSGLSALLITVKFINSLFPNRLKKRI